MTPETLAKILGISAKTLRAWLRENYNHPKNDPWELTHDAVLAACGHFGFPGARPPGSRLEALGR